ncbi:MAG: TIGR03619 family F420-dependent LLM class oxidoreductase, partial [Candidatus Rokubacteria bacterium]|nr:TIGR03619 family F420-dependent LLM class oxidoreductase [Candidatus Rokubacteria bacterium]
MEFGVHLPTTQPAAETKASLVTFAQEAERRGFASLWVSDHVVIPRGTSSYPQGGRFPVPPDRPYLEPVVGLAAAAAVTTRARLGCSVFILGHRHPVVMAKMLASIDALAGGRLICGVGVGWWREELEILGVPFHARGRQADEILRIFKALWTAEAPAFEGEFFRFRDIGFEPKPLAKPHPPIWVGGAAPGALRRVAALGDGWHAMSRSVEDFRRGIETIHAECEKIGRDPRAIEI